AEQLLKIGPLAEDPEREGEEPDRRLLAGGKEVGSDEGDVLHVGGGPVGECRSRHYGQNVAARSAATVLNVRGELVVEELQRLVRQLDLASRQRRELSSELRVIGLRHALEVGDDQEGEGAGVLADELALGLGEELVELTVGESPHELLVLAEPPGRQEPHQQS